MEQKVGTVELLTTSEKQAFEQEYFAELHRLADIGRATEKAFEKGVILTNPNNYADEYCIGSGSLIESVEELLAWAKGE